MKILLHEALRPDDHFGLEANSMLAWRWETNIDDACRLLEEAPFALA